MRGDPAVVYLARAEDGLYKIGWSTRPLERMKTLAAKLRQEVSLIHLIESDCPDWLEEVLHEHYLEKSAGGEWFTLSDEDVVSFRRVLRLNRPEDFRLGTFPPPDSPPVPPYDPEHWTEKAKLVRLTVHLTAAERQDIATAAHGAHLSVSEFARRIVVSLARAGLFHAWRTGPWWERFYGEGREQKDQNSP
jgi:hypothetical protein